MTHDTVTQTKHTPGSVRAARELLRLTVRGELIWNAWSAEAVSSIIARETAAPDLLAACVAILAAWQDNSVTLATFNELIGDRFEPQLERAIAKAKGEL